MNCNVLKIVRQANGLTAQEVVKRSGINIFYIYELEGGKKTNVRKSTIKKLADAYNLTEMQIAELDNYYDFMKTMSDSEYLEAYYAAAELVEPLIGLERSEQLVWIATYLRIIFESGMTYSMSAPHYNDPYGYLILGAASCAGCAKATGMCLNILGIPYEHVNEGQYSHQWCRVYVDGEYWICDAYGLYVGPEPAPYVHPYLS